MRVVIAQPCPPCMHTIAPLPIWAGKSASSRMMLADLPPSSRNTRFRVSEPCAMIRFPTAVDPVKLIMSTSRLARHHFADGRRITRRDDVEHTGRDVRVLRRDPPDVRRAPRSVGRRLQHDGVAGRERGNDLGEVEHEREVPRRDRADDADRLPQHAPGAAHPEEFVHREVEFPVDPVDALDVPLHVVDAGVHLHGVGEHDRRTDLGDDQRAQGLALLGQRLLQLSE